MLNLQLAQEIVTDFAARRIVPEAARVLRAMMRTSMAPGDTIKEAKVGEKFFLFTTLFCCFEIIKRILAISRNSN
jgi:hypothetical protein